MTKRYGSYQSNRGKKIKLEDEIWDNDIDDEALNHCFEVASQVYDQVYHYMYFITLYYIELF